MRRKTYWLAAELSLVWPLLSLSPVMAQQPIIAPTTTCDPLDLPVAPTQPLSATEDADLSNLGPLPDADPALDIPQDPAAVTVQSTPAITLSQAFTLARQRNRDLQIAELDIAEQRASLRQARAALYPTLDAQAGITRTDSAQARIAIKQQEADLPPGFPAPEQSSVSNSFNGTVSLNYDIFTSGQRPASIRAAESALESTEQAYQTELLQLRLDVANDYYDLQQSDELVRIAQQAVSNAAENLRVSQARESAGIGTRFEVLQAEVQLADRRQQLTQAENQQQVSQRQMAQRLSLPSTFTPTAADPVAMAGGWSPSLEESIIQALNNRTELAEVLAQRQIAQQNRRIARGSLGPQLDFNASISVADDLVDDQSGAFGYALGAEASKLIFDGGSSRAIASQQAINATIAETQFASFKNLIRFQVERNYYTLQSAKERIQTTQCAIEQAKQGLELAKLRRDFGVGTSLEVSNATTDLAQAENNYLTAIVDYNRALAALQRFANPQTQTNATPE